MHINYYSSVNSHMEITTLPACNNLVYYKVAKHLTVIIVI